MIGPIVLLQKSRKRMQLWMLNACSKYLMSSRPNLFKKVRDAYICREVFSN